MHKTNWIRIQTNFFGARCPGNSKTDLMKPSVILFLLFITNSFLSFTQVLSTDNAKQNVKVFNIIDYGAVGDGLSLNTEAINKAIYECSEAGGGTVLIPAGRFLTGTVQLKSNITLFLDKDASIMATDDKSQFKGADVKPEDEDEPIGIGTNSMSYWTRAIVLLEKVENVTISGTGTIDGMVLVPRPHREIHGIMVTESKNIVISDITVTRAGDWSIVGFYVEDFKVSNVTVTDGYDGIHVRSGKKLVFENCKLYSRDDAIAGGYWVDALITDCTLNSACNGIRIVLPTINLEIRNCYIVGPGVFGHNRGPVDNPWITSTLTGIILQPGAWGKGTGILDNIYIHDIIIKDVQTALTFVLNEGNTARDILVENVVATGISHNACSVEAWPAESKYEYVKFKNVSVSYQITDPDLLKVKNFERPRTESRPLPFWGFYVRNVKNIEFENVKLDFKGEEVRSVMGFDNVESVKLKNVHYKKVEGIQSLIYSDSTKMRITGSAAFK
jgi:hypothetical protein